ncbi:D-amino-acid dehydrogenase [Arthrobacter pigmenti]|uniref:D-amino-acid dehydrogenase n=1 Tax=Arthrobacter pigmenti TaxID=271432 RepID=A0A846RUL8_9MICC|nr:FAD-dependent oxidoreductase [Arthrobacter pigmenti]NJC22716.1 D-amino-acid dehydrogenase [Arthrobacter pigmenti]
MNTCAGNSADVVIIGAGAVGASIAYELSKRGASVIVLDGGKNIGNGCSYANAGLLAPSHVEPLATPANVAAGIRYMFSPGSPFYVRPTPRLVPWFARLVASASPRRVQALTARMRELATRSLQLHEEYAMAGLPTGFRKSGSLDVFLTEKHFHQTTGVLRSRPASPATEEILSAVQARKLEPMLGEVAGAIYRPQEAQCGSQDFVRATLEAAEQFGARVFWNTQVHQLPLAGGRIAAADTNNGRFTADTYVVAAGLGSEKLCRGVGIRMPMAGAKGYVVDLAPDGPSPQIPLSFKELKVVATPYSDRLRLCGTLELGSDPEAMSARRIQAIRDAGHRGLPELKFRRTLQTWAGQRPCTADGVPSLGRSTTRPNLVVAAGHGMWGLVLAPVTGELIAQGILEAAPSLHEAAFSPDRFGRHRRFTSNLH